MTPDSPDLRTRIAAALPDALVWVNTSNDGAATVLIEETARNLAAALALSGRTEAGSGLDVERLARAMHNEALCENWSPGYWHLNIDGAAILDEEADMDHHRRDAQRLVARLALPAATEEP